MKRLLMVLLTLAGISASAALAGTCGYHGYSSSGSYYSPYRSSSYYWAGGYWPGGSGYAAGYYGAGYYPSYGASYAYEEPVFYRYKAVIPLVELSSYRAYYHEPPPERAASAPAPATYASPPVAAPAGAPCAATAAGSMMDQKIDRLLAIAQETSSEVGTLRLRIEVLEKANGITPPLKATKPPAAKPAATKPPAEPTPPADGDENTRMATILHTYCASCHDSKVVMKERSKVTLFATGPDGPELATLNEKGELTPLPLSAMKKIEKVLADSTMPPEKDASGKAVARMPPAERQQALAGIRKVITGWTDGR